MITIDARRHDDARALTAVLEAWGEETVAVTEGVVAAPAAPSTAGLHVWTAAAADGIPAGLEGGVAVAVCGRAADIALLARRCGCVTPAGLAAAAIAAGVCVTRAGTVPAPKVVLRRARLVGAERAVVAATTSGSMPARALGAFHDGTPRERAFRRMSLALPASARRAVARGLGVAAADTARRISYWDGARGVLGRRVLRDTVRGVPILMYHAFAGRRGDANRFVVPRARLARQLRVLRLMGLRPIDLPTLARAIASGTPLPRRAVVLTIDDGYLDNATIGIPLMRAHGHAPTLFLATGHMGGANAWDGAGPLAGRRIMTWQDAAALRARGTILGAHTRHHPRLAHVDAATCRSEIGGSLDDCRRRLGDAPECFAYPYGSRTGATLEVARDEVPLCAVATHPRLASAADDPMDLPRIEVRGTDSLVRFVLALTLGGAA